MPNPGLLTWSRTTLTETPKKQASLGRPIRGHYVTGVWASLGVPCQRAEKGCFTAPENPAGMGGIPVFSRSGHPCMEP